MTFPSHLPAFACLVAGLLVTGCSSIPSRVSREREVLPTDVTPSMVRIAANTFSHRFVQAIEQAADAITAGTKDPAIRRHALLWKIHGTAAVLLAQDHPAPLGAIADTFALCIQMHDFLREGRGRDLFGPGQPIAIQAAEKLEQDMEIVFQRNPMKAGIADLPERLRAWAAAHPLDDLTFVRYSGSGTVDALLSSLGGEGVVAAVQNLESELFTMHSKLARYLGQLPRQVRWQAELLALETAGEDQTGLIATATTELDRQRELALADVDRQRSNALGVLREERLALSETLARERATLVEDGRRSVAEALDRIEALTARLQRESVSALQTQRVDTLETLRRERLETLAGLEVIAEKTVDRTLERGFKLMGTAWLGLASLLVLARCLFRPARPRP